MILSITFFFTAVIGRICYVQLYDGTYLQARAAEQWMRDLPITPSRGKILDCNGVVLANSSTLYSVYLRPNSTPDKAAAAAVLSRILELDYDKLYTKFTTTRVSEITVSKSVEHDKMLEIVEADVMGIYISENILRYYPYGDFLTQILGYTNADRRGQEGLEKYYDNYLYGLEGYALTEADLTGRELSASTRYIPSVAGHDVTLTIDYYLQALAESAVEDAMERHKALSASCILMNAKTGAILALANAPSFDLNNVPRDNIIELYTGAKNHILTDVIEPGSTFKIVTAAAALEEHVATEKSTYYCGGNRIVDGQKIKCWKTRGHGSQTFGEAVKNSCNCCFMDCALGLGTERFYSYLSKFGLFEKTGIALSGESAGIAIAKDSVKNVDLARIGFGQAIAVTPLQLITAAAAAVNGGKLMQPYIVSNIFDSASGKLAYTCSPTVKNTVISEHTSAELRGYLEGVVSEGGGKNAYVDGYRIGGKTGTAQKYMNGAIAQGKYVSSFIGFAPADNPEYIMLMIVDEPSAGVYYGSIVAAPYANYIYSNLFKHFGIEAQANDKDAAYNTYFEMPDITGMSYADACSTLRVLGISYEIEGEGGTVSYQLPVTGSLINKYTTAFIRFD